MKTLIVSEKSWKFYNDHTYEGMPNVIYAGKWKVEGRSVYIHTGGTLDEWDKITINNDFICGAKKAHAIIKLDEEIEEFLSEE